MPLSTLPCHKTAGSKFVVIRCELIHKLIVDGRCSKVEEMKRRQTYRREMLLQRIALDTDKALTMKASRAELQDARRMANMHSSFERQQLMQSIERLQV